MAQDKDWKKLALQMGLNAEAAVERIKRNMDRMFGTDKPLRIQVYQAFGTRHSVLVYGRVLQCVELASSDIDTRWNNLQASFRRFNTDEVPGEVVSASLAGHSAEALTDDEGYFSFQLPADSINGTGNDEVEVQLSVSKGELQTSTCLPVSLIDEHATLGIISDIDDTIVVTEAASLTRMVRLTLLESPRTRAAFDGVSAFYRSLVGERNPVFYVSSSPWNLYQFLIDFMQLNRIPTGAMFLRDFGLDEHKFIAGKHEDHKLISIQRILDSTGELPFVLIGDSGQRDPEIYAQIARQHVSRISDIYIRDVTGAARERQIQGLIAEMRSLGIGMLLVPDTRAAAVHAAARGHIRIEDYERMSEALNRPNLPV